MMELLGTWKLKAVFSADENGAKRLDAAGIEALGDEDLLKMLHADFILSETSLDVYYMPTEEEMPLVKEEGWELTDKGVLIDSYPTKIEGGVLLLDYDKTSEVYTPVPIDEEGCLTISDGMMILQKA